MMYGITGTPGTGKSSLAAELERRGYRVVRLIDTVDPYRVGFDEQRGVPVVDEQAWAEEFPHIEGFVEGHLAHFLSCDLLFVLRCRPDVLGERLRSRGYPPEKIRENVEAEALDLILQEAADSYRPDQIHEIDTTQVTPNMVADEVEQVITGERAPSWGHIDWSSYLGAGR